MRSTRCTSKRPSPSYDPDHDGPRKQTHSKADQPLLVCQCDDAVKLDTGPEQRAGISITKPFQAAQRTSSKIPPPFPPPPLLFLPPLLVPGPPLKTDARDRLRLLMSMVTTMMSALAVEEGRLTQTARPLSTHTAYLRGPRWQRASDQSESRGAPSPSPAAG